MFIEANDMVINDQVVIPVVARPGVAAMATKLNASISGWDNNTWDLSRLVQGRVIS